MTHRSFEKDINWMERNKRDMQSNPLPRLFAIVVIVIGILAAGSTAVVNAASDQPDYQNGNSIQNMFENYIAWKDYTDELDAVWLDEENPVDRPYMAELIGEAFSASASLLIHYENNAYPTGACAQDFYYHFNDIVTWYTLFYGSAYHTLTANVGEPIEFSTFLEEAGQAEEWMLQNVSAKCWAKLDT